MLYLCYMKPLQRSIGLAQAVSINMTDMVGIGPFITLPMVIGLMNGSFFLYAWIAGAVLSFFDAMVWSELGTAFPAAGGSYNFLKEAYGKTKAGKLMSFIFVWQTLFQAPLVLASAAIGFSAYFSYLMPLGELSSKILSGCVVILIIILLYRNIETVGKLSVLLWLGVLATLVWIIGGGIYHGNFLAPLQHINDNLKLNAAFGTALGFASVKTMYSFLGYYNVCHLGSEIKDPEKNIPRSMFISIAGITVLYLLMNISVVSVIPWEQAKDNKFVVSIFIQQIAGIRAAKVATCMILWVAFASLFSATLGYSRIPYAAAADGSFFKFFARLHPTRHFPYVSLLFLGSLAFLFSLLFKLTEVISAILALRIFVQFIGQAVGLLLLRKKIRTEGVYKMPLYPIPVFIVIAMWLGILISTGIKMLLFGSLLLLMGLIVFFIKAKINKEWPF